MAPPPLAAGGWPAVDGPVAEANGHGADGAGPDGKKKKAAGVGVGTVTMSPPAVAPRLLPPIAADGSFAKSFVRLRSSAGDSYLDPKSLKVVRTLGEGGFAKVELCELLAPPHRANSSSSSAFIDASTAAGNLSPRRTSYDAASEASTTGRPLVAVKRLHPHLFSTPKELDAFSGEIRLLKSLSHPNIVAFVGAGALEDAKSAYIAQEYVGGGTLGQLIVKQCMQGGGGEQVGAAATAEGDPTGATFRRRSSGVFASFFSSQAVYQAGDAVDIMLQVAKALNYLHTRSPMVLHRDIKPDNVLLAAPLPTAAAAARRRRRLALLANSGGNGGGSGLSVEAAAAAAGNVAPSDGSVTTATNPMGPGVGGNGGAQRNRSLPGRRPSFTSLTGADAGAIEPEREWVAKLTDFGLSTSVAARRQKEQIQRIASAALVRSRSSAAAAAAASGTSAAGHSVASSAGGSSAFSSAALSALRAEANSPGGVHASTEAAPAAINLAPASSGELELDWNLRIQSRTMVAPSFRMGHGGGPGGGGGGGGPGTLATVGEGPSTSPSNKTGGASGAAGGGGGTSPLNAIAEPCEHGSYELTRNTGSLMYMAPEVFKGQPYNEKADVFSFAVLLREVLAAYLTSFAMGSVTEIEMYANRVSNGFRPPLDPRWPEPLRTLISDCWHQDPRKRPSMAEVVKRLERIVRELPLLPRVGREPPAPSEAGGGAPGNASEASGAAKGPAMCGACVVQ